MLESINRNPLLVVTLLVSLALSACSGKIPGVYRIPIQQGNVITVKTRADRDFGTTNAQESDTHRMTMWLEFTR